MVLQCQFPVGPLYYRVRSALGHLQDVVIIPPARGALLGQLCRSQLRQQPRRGCKTAVKYLNRLWGRCGPVQDASKTLCAGTDQG